jgi:hypothetical protein
MILPQLTDRKRKRLTLYDDIGDKKSVGKILKQVKAAV